MEELTFVLIISTFISSIPLLLLLFRRVRLSVVRTLISDFGHIQSYSQIGKMGADAKTRSRVQSMVDETIVHDVIPWAAEKMTNNPFAAPLIKFVLDETALGEAVRENAELLPMVFDALGKYNLESLAQMDFTGLTQTQKQDITDGFNIG